MNKKKIILILAIALGISIIINIVFGVSEFAYRTKKDEVKDAVTNVENGINDIENIISTNNNQMEKEYQEKIDDLLDFYTTNGEWELIDPIKTKAIEENNIISVKDSADVIIEIGTNRMRTTMPNDVESLQKLVRKIEYSHNSLNQMLLNERDNRVYITKTITNKVVEIRTNIQVVYEKLDHLEKPKTWSFSVGIGGSWNGRISGINVWNVNIHGLVFFKNMIYGGITLGIESQLTVQPSIGFMAGWKFN